jgi:hypothetical protein
MRRNWITLGAGAILLGAAFSSGCESPRPQPVTRTYSYPAWNVANRPPVQPVRTNPVQAPAPTQAAPAEVATAPAALTQPTEMAASTKTENAPIEQVSMKEEPATDRRSFNDITAHPCFAHAEDYQWLRGQVQFSHISKSWRLRYASVDESDKYGGSVTLVGDQMDSLKDGQYVQIRGKIVEAEGRSTAPGYQVDAIEPVENK